MRLGMVLIALFLSLLSVPAFAQEDVPQMNVQVQEQEQIFEQLRPLLEMTTAACVNQPDHAYEFTNENTLSPEFTGMLELLSSDYLHGQVVNADNVESFMKANFIASAPSGVSVPDKKPDRYTGLMLIACEPSPDGAQLAVTAEVYQAPAYYLELTEEQWNELIWLDMRAIFTLQNDPSSDYGWKIASLTFVPSFFSDDTDHDSTVPEAWYYYQDKYGYAVPVPSLFPGQVVETENGFSVQTADASASLSAEYLPLQDTLASKVQEYADLHSSSEIYALETGNAYLLEYQDNQRTSRVLFSGQSDAVLIVSLTWDPQMMQDFGPVCDFIFQNIMIGEDFLG